MDFKNGLADFQIGDEVNLIMPPTTNIDTYGFGILEDDWRTMESHNPHLIIGTKVIGRWEGYRLAKCEELLNNDLCWPYWGFEQIATTASVIDLL